VAITIISPISLGSARVKGLLAAILLVTAVLGCKSQSKAKDDDDEDERPSAAASAAARSPAAPGSARGNVAPASVTAVNAPPQAQSAITWNFDAATAGSPPASFSFGRTGSGRPGRWVVRAAPDAPSGPNVLAQEDNDRTDYRFPIAVEDSVSFKDVSLSVRCKPIEGKVDRACGIIWRYRDENNYYLTRANALEDNVRFYYVENGRRREVRGWNGKVSAGVWHELRADMRGDRVQVYFDGTKVIEAQDARFGAPGKIGVWTKADSHTLFDNLTATPLGS
jgi:hypothetical protein